MEAFKKALYYFYYKIYGLGKLISDDALNSWKPLIALSVLQLFVLISADLWIEMITGNSYFLSQPTPVLLIVALGLVAFDEYIVFNKRKMKPYFKVFKQYSKKKDMLGVFGILSVITCVLTFLVFTFYRYRQLPH